MENDKNQIVSAETDSSPTEALEMTAKKTTSPLFEKLSAYLPILKYKTPFDKVDYSCAENIIRGFVKPFIMMYGVRALISLIKAIFTLKKQLLTNPVLLIKALVNLDNFKFGCFFGSFTALLKSGIVLGRVFRKKDDGWNAFLGAFIAGWLSMFLFGKQTRGWVTCFMLSRALDTIYNHLCDKGLIKRSDLHHMILLSIMSGLIGYTYAQEVTFWGPGGLKENDRSASRLETDKILTQMRQLIHEMMTLGTGVKQNQ